MSRLDRRYGAVKQLPDRPLETIRDKRATSANQGATMSIRIDTNWSYHGLDIVRVENRHLIVDIAPQLGGKVLHLVDKAADRQLLWRNPRVAPQRFALEANADDYYCGGWDEVLINASPGPNRYGDPLPSMGELRSTAMTVSVEMVDGAAVVELHAALPISPLAVTRRFTIDDRPLVRTDTDVVSVSSRPLDLTWGSHCAIAPTASMRVDAPATDVLITDAGGGVLGQAGAVYDYPDDGGARYDIRNVGGADVADFALHALRGLRAGWIAATDVATRRGVGLVFDPAHFPVLWQWMSYGGTRGWHHVIIEPWSTAALSLADAIADGTARVLAPGGQLSTSVTAVVYGGCQSVTGLTADGHVVGAS
jgi:hypothetical protein